MARLIFEKAVISDAGADTNQANISGIVTESITLTEEALQVAIEDNQNINEGYTSTMSFRTRNLKFDDDTTDINNSSSNVYFGTGTPTKKRLKMVGINGGDDYYIDNVYVMGRRVFENGREEFEISAQIDSTTTTVVRA